MFYLIASNNNGEQRILDACPTQDGVKSMLGFYLKQTNGCLVSGFEQMNNEGIHITEEKPLRHYKIYHTTDAGWIRSSYWSTKVLEYRVLQFIPPAIRVNFPPVNQLSDALVSKKHNINDKSIFF